MIPGNTGTTERGMHQQSAYLELARRYWLVVTLMTALLGAKEVLDMLRGGRDESVVAMPAPLDVRLATTLIGWVLAWVVTLAWVYPRAVALKSEPRRASLWYGACCLLTLATCLGPAAASNHQRPGLALMCWLANLGLLMLVCPRARDFPEEEPPPAAPLWDGAIQIKRFACPHCGARTFSLSDKLWVQSSVLRACRKCRAWIGVPWLWDAFRWAVLMTSGQSLPFVVRVVEAAATARSLLAGIALSIAMMAGMWVAVSALMPLVTRYPPPSRSADRGP